jgi:uracil-DNA glycosylase
MFQFPKNSWLPIFHQAMQSGLLDSVSDKLEADSTAGKTIFPASKDIFRAFDLCDLDQLKVVLLGQDPYHGEGEANGLCFSVCEGIRTPPSLRNIFKELKNEYPSFDEKRSTDLSDWAEQGVLLINSVLTVERDKPASHSGYGWQVFTDYIISEISKHKNYVVFILLGKFAQSKVHLIDLSKHLVIAAAHPSPFSAHRGFLDSDVFRKCNSSLAFSGEEIVW